MHVQTGHEGFNRMQISYLVFSIRTVFRVPLMENTGECFSMKIKLWDLHITDGGLHACTFIYSHSLQKSH